MTAYKITCFTVNCQKQYKGRKLLSLVTKIPGFNFWTKRIDKSSTRWEEISEGRNNTNHWLSNSYFRDYSSQYIIYYKQYFITDIHILIFWVIWFQMNQLNDTPLICESKNLKFVNMDSHLLMFFYKSTFFSASSSCACKSTITISLSAVILTLSFKASSSSSILSFWISFYPGKNIHWFLAIHLQYREQRDFLINVVQSTAHLKVRNHLDVRLYWRLSDIFLNYNVFSA